jgi:hypothetical protein
MDGFFSTLYNSPHVVYTLFKFVIYLLFKAGVI